jgi:hypothetical protein
MRTKNIRKIRNNFCTNGISYQQNTDGTMKKGGGGAKKKN